MRIYFMAAALLALSLPAHAGTVIETTKASEAKSKEPAQPASVYLSANKLAENQADIDRLADYLTALTTIEADFTQASSDGSVGEGKFYLQRPGKMRWEYAPPTPILIVSSDNELVYFDKELEQVTRIPIDSTLAGFLAQEKIRFDGEIGVEYFEKSANVIRLRVSQRSKPDEGKLMMEFSDNPLQLKRMEIVDAAGVATQVSLENAQFGKKLDKKLFVFRDTRKRRVQ